MDKSQTSIAAVSDLLILALCRAAGRSARMRAAQHPGWNTSLYEVFLPWCQARAAELFREVTGEKVSLPKIGHVDYEGVGARAVGGLFIS